MSSGGLQFKATPGIRLMRHHLKKKWWVCGGVAPVVSAMREM
jgi:hypothetical protein